MPEQNSPYSRKTRYATALRMRVLGRAYVLCLGFTLLSYAQESLAVDLVVEALLPGTAVLRIDGRRTTLKVGKSSGGVRLISADAKSAVVEINGQRQQLGVSQRISGQFSAPEKRAVRIPLDQARQYRTNAEINGVRISVIVDTGANIIAMSERHAQLLGIDPTVGTQVRVTTAGSQVPGRSLLLDSVDVGGIRVHSVEATVIKGDFPVDVLLGMSFLEHVQMVDENGVLTLEARF
ncbi:MAG: TIGR02281 family clan AA aspartic protease [Pseudomonadota bacterium]